MTAYSLQPTAYSLQPTAYSLQPTAYSLQPTAYSLQPTAYSLQPTAYSLQPRLTPFYKPCKINFKKFLTSRHTPIYPFKTLSEDIIRLFLLCLKKQGISCLGL
ncbi:hypothetical protein FWK50_06710 [Histophilus somni]|nr:hypothetical protein FWK47_06710 [Histophilus somni]QEH16480.1 hypothetical protein FWK50_06710 [Histophilus somni]QEH20102.1 hypothetical protein FWK49_06735 [Histophilus somni]QEH21892.1 hypothetical protein FWK55_06730 [Histophilus somni]QEH23688.1 hypothetical protein FWK58_06750 [Histophilus somni]